MRLALPPASGRRARPEQRFRYRPATASIAHNARAYRHGASPRGAGRGAATPASTGVTRQPHRRTESALFRGRNNADCSDLVIAPTWRHASWLAPVFAGARSEQSAFSAAAVAHPIRVNERAPAHAKHDCAQPLDLLPVGFLGCRRRERATDPATAPGRYPPADQLLALLDGVRLFRPARVRSPCHAGPSGLRSEQRRRRNNRRSAREQRSTSAHGAWRRGAS